MVANKGAVAAVAEGRRIGRIRWIPTNPSVEPLPGRAGGSGCSPSIAVTFFRPVGSFTPAMRATEPLDGSVPSAIHCPIIVRSPRPE